MRRLTIACAVLALVVLQAGVVNAAPLGLEFPHYPRVWANDIDVSYDAGTGLFEAVWGYAVEQYDDANEVLTYIDGDFNLSVYLNEDGTLASSTGSLLVTSDYEDPDSILFYSTHVERFGFSTVDVFEFEFTQQGPGLPPEGEPIGVILTGASIDPDDFDPNAPVPFANSFTNGGNGYADVFYLPEPATAALLGLGALAALRVRRKV